MGLSVSPGCLLSELSHHAVRRPQLAYMRRPRGKELRPQMAAGTNHQTRVNEASGDPRPQAQSHSVEVPDRVEQTQATPSVPCLNSHPTKSMSIVKVVSHHYIMGSLVTYSR